jgi:type II secretory pathway pseudopilin PulG
MNTCVTPNRKPAPDDADPVGRGLVKLAMIASGYVFLATLTLSLLLPALGNAREQNRNKQNTTQVRGIVQSLITYASANKEKMPGTSSKGFILQDDGTENSLTGRSGHGATVEARFWLLLDNNSFSGEYLISPAETKTAWTTGQVASANYSYALLNIHSDGSALDSEKTRPDQIGRAREWKTTINTQAVLIADRARIPGGRIGDDYDKIYSVHTEEDSKTWAGSVGRGDGSASFHFVDALDTKYDGATRIENDRLFSLDQDSGRNIDVISNPDHTWDVRSNALLGYTSVGYEDGDIASD